MTTAPPIRYARSGPVNIAYCRWGEGTETVVYTPPLVSNVELFWELPEFERVLHHGGNNHDTLMLDKRGVGLSDRISDAPTLADRIADTIAVIDAERLGPVHLVGQSEGGEIALAIAAKQPERVKSLIVIGAPITGVPREVLAELADADNPFPTADDQAERWRALVRHWGSEESINLEIFAPSVADDPRIRRWYQHFERQSASPGAVLAFMRSISRLDVTSILNAVNVPTMVVHGRGDRIVPVANGRFLAQAIPGARYFEYPGDDHLWQLGPDWRAVQDEMIPFITGRAPRSAVETKFAAVLFTDLVDSTTREATVGDRAWRHLLDRHDRLSGELIARGGGRVVKQTGDGMLATFDDPADAVASGVRLSRELGRVGLPIRAGIHAGRIEIRDGDVSGITVNLAARVLGCCDGGEVIVSRTVRDLLLGTQYVFEELGSYELKGIPGSWQLYSALA